MSIRDRVRKLDDFQQRHSWLAFPVAVVKKRGDDEGGDLAALIAYYAFFSLFPLLLVFVTVLGFVVQGNQHEQSKILHSTLSQFPIIGDQIQKSVGSVHGSGVALAIGLFGALWAGLGVTIAAQKAFNRVWGVPHTERPGFAGQRLRGLGLLVVLGTANLLATVAAGRVGAGSGGTLTVVAGTAVSLLVNFLLFLGAFRLLTVRDVAIRDLLPGVIIATVFWFLLQTLGGYYVNHTLRHAQQIYGLFAVVIGLLTFLYLGAQLILLAAEVNVVRAKRLWPRSLIVPPLTEGDERALAEIARSEERVEPEQVDVHFDESARSST